jgi:hypothetical protein
MGSKLLINVWEEYVDDWVWMFTSPFHLDCWTTNRLVESVEKGFVKKKVDFPLNALLGFGS